MHSIAGVSFVYVSVEKPRQNLLDNAGAFFGSVCTGLVHRQPCQPGRTKNRISIFFSGKPDTYAIASGKWVVFRGRKNAEKWAKLSNHFDFCRKYAGNSDFFMKFGVLSVAAALVASVEESPVVFVMLPHVVSASMI